MGRRSRADARDEDERGEEQGRPDLGADRRREERRHPGGHEGQQDHAEQGVQGRGRPLGG
ncbi:hypothetical protein ACW14Y_41475 [Kitasatospora sp. cg17-2]